MKTIITLILLVFLTACSFPPIKSFTTEGKYTVPIQVEQPSEVTDPFILGEEVKTPSGCTEGVDC